MEEKSTELMRKREELHDVSNKKYRDSVAKEKVWVQKRRRIEPIWLLIFFIAHFEVTIIPLLPSSNN
jgi:hypothetical protein